MKPETEKLQKDYRRIKAPPFLATRIMAGIRPRPSRRRWLPAVAAAALVMVIVSVAPRLADRQPAITETSPMSLAALSRMSPGKAPLPSPSLSQLKSIKSPPLPQKPTMQPVEEPQSRLPDAAAESEEHNHA